MSTKLTLSIDSVVINQAKKHLQTKNVSLSSLVEEYFKALVAIKTKKTAKTSIVKELSGIASTKKSKNLEENELIADYLLEKYQ